MDNNNNNYNYKTQVQSNGYVGSRGMNAAPSTLYACGGLLMHAHLPIDPSQLGCTLCPFPEPSSLDRRCQLNPCNNRQKTTVETVSTCGSSVWVDDTPTHESASESVHDMVSVRGCDCADLVEVSSVRPAMPSARPAASCSCACSWLPTRPAREDVCLLCEMPYAQSRP